METTLVAAAVFVTADLVAATFTCAFAAGAFDAGLETATGLETVTGLV